MSLRGVVIVTGKECNRKVICPLSVDVNIDFSFFLFSTRCMPAANVLFHSSGGQLFAIYVLCHGNMGRDR
jgi:hypothetical protein